MTLAACGVFIAGFSSILTGFNFIVTVHRMRAPGMTWFRLPLFVWAKYATSLVMILGTPVIAITICWWRPNARCSLGIFDPKRGGDPVLFQHLFWFYSHPAVYIMILPGMGVISELVAAISRKQVFGYSFVAFSSLAIAILGFLVWGHHLFVSSQSIYAGLVFSIITMLVAVPSAVKTFNWTATMYKGSVTWESPTYWVIGFMGLFTIGGLTGLFLAAMGMDIHLHRHVLRRRPLPLHHGGRRDHGVHGRPPLLVAEDDRQAVHRSARPRSSAILVFVGFNLTFFPQFILGYMGMPRRYHAYPDEFQVLNVLSSAGASILGLGLPAAGVLLHLFDLQGTAGAGQSVGRQGPRMDDSVAAADVQLRRGSPVVTEPAYNYNAEPGGARWLSPTSSTLDRAMASSRSLRRTTDRADGAHAHHPKLQHHFYSMEQQLEASILGMWVFLVTEVMFFGGMFMAYIVYRTVYPEAWVAGSHHLNVPPRRAEHRRAHLQLADDGAGGAVGTGRIAHRPDRQPDPDDAARLHLPRRQVLRVQGEVRAPPGAGSALQPGPARRRNSCSSRSTSS